MNKHLFEKVVFTVLLGILCVCISGLFTGCAWRAKELDPVVIAPIDDVITLPTEYTTGSLEIQYPKDWKLMTTSNDHLIILDNPENNARALVKRHHEHLTLQEELLSYYYVFIQTYAGIIPAELQALDVDDKAINYKAEQFIDYYGYEVVHYFYEIYNEIGSDSTFVVIILPMYATQDEKVVNDVLLIMNSICDTESLPEAPKDSYEFFPEFVEELLSHIIPGQHASLLED